MYTPRPLKLLYLRNKAWYHITQRYNDIRDVVMENVTKMLACGTLVMGSRTYTCSNGRCLHTKTLGNTCKSRACNSCGVKSTNQWIAKQQSILPDCEWQHITFTMPDILWPIFKSNRHLLEHLFRCASDVLLHWAKQKNIDVGMFSALHTFGRQLTWNTHIHLSVTRGGLCMKSGKWKPIYFNEKVVAQSWKTKILTLLRQQYSQLILPEAMANQIRDYQEWSRYLDPLYHRYWRVFFAKKTKHAKQTVNYLGRYLKRPPIAASRLKHYDGKDITFVFLNHRTKQYETGTLTQEAMILRINDHIPEKHFRMLRYYGFLSNRRRGEQLPLVYKALEMDVEPAPALGFAALMKGFTNVDPYACILCGGRLVFNTYHRGLSTSELVHHQRSLALMRPIRS